ncbi:hypothetical protein L2E82_12022 [Cichorium intybus]|uniref:Uncharacterized protein n=1 Tax=Cichorium intybus TaxID=13427 RepID=A0ACB9GGX0_CICIN|nr:hypothetical protein L2E82_12022 [Cichorium intybus]
MATGAAAIMLHCVFEGSLSMSEIDKERRPYHKNCSCALHRPKDETPTTCNFFCFGRIRRAPVLSMLRFWHLSLCSALLTNVIVDVAYKTCKVQSLPLMDSWSIVLSARKGRAFINKHKWAPERLQEYVIVFLKEAYQYCVKSSKSGDHTIKTAAASALHRPKDETPTACFHNTRIHTERSHHGTIIHCRKLAHVLCFGGNQQKVRTFLGVGNVLVQPQTTQSYVKYQKAKGRIGVHDTDTGAAGDIHYSDESHKSKNCKELISYILEFDEVAPEMYLNEPILGLRDKYFATWFEQKVMLQSLDGSASHLEILAMRPSPYALSHNGYFQNKMSGKSRAKVASPSGSRKRSRDDSRSSGARPPLKTTGARPLPKSTGARPPPKSTGARPSPTSSGARPPPKSSGSRPSPTSTRARPPPTSIVARPPPTFTRDRPPPTSNVSPQSLPASSRIGSPEHAHMDTSYYSE